jgi:hypothetical protein
VTIVGRSKLATLAAVAAVTLTVTAGAPTLGPGEAGAVPVQSGGGCSNGVNAQECNAGVGLPGRTVDIGGLDVGGGGGSGDGCEYAPYSEYFPERVDEFTPREGYSDQAVMYLRVCPEDDFGMSEGVVVWFEPGDEPAPPPSATDVMEALWAEVQGLLLAPELQLQPAEPDRSVIHVPTFVAITNPQPATRYTGSAAGIEVWIDVWPTVTLNPGEPDAPAIPCDDDGTTYNPGGPEPDVQAEGECAYSYQRVSAGGWTGDVTITWNVTWDSSVAGEQGSLSTAPSTTTFGRIVDELPVIVTDVDD